MNISKNILVIDDEDQANDLQKIAKQLCATVLVKWKQIDVLANENLDEEANFVAENLKQVIENALDEHFYDLILVDYSYGNIPFDGLDAIDFIKNKRANANVILYSANQKEIIRKVLNTRQTNNLSDNDIVKAINTLMNYRILKMCKRETYVDDVVKYLSKDTQLSPTSMLCEMLREHGEMKFSSCCPKLAGKNFADIAKILEEPGNGNATEWLNSMFEQLLSYLVEIKE